MKTSPTDQLQRARFAQVVRNVANALNNGAVPVPVIKYILNCLVTDAVLLNTDYNIQLDHDIMRAVGMGKPMGLMFGAAMARWASQSDGDLLNKVGDAHEWGCLFAPAPSSIAGKLAELQANIPADALHEKGIETEPHMTVVYGFPAGYTADKLKDVLAGPLEAKLGTVERFHNDDYDVLKVGVECPKAQELHDAILAESGDVMKEQDYPFNGHITLAYLKPGSPLTPIDGRVLDLSTKFDTLTLSQPAREGQPQERTVIPLNEPEELLNSNPGHAGRPGQVGGSAAAYAGPTMLPQIGSVSAQQFPHIPLSKAQYHLIGHKGDYGLYEFANQRMGGKSLTVLHHPTGWMKPAPDRTTASKMASRHADSLIGKSADYGGKDGWGATPTFNWTKHEPGALHNSFPGHEGIPGHQGGSLPKENGKSNPEPTAIKSVGYYQATPVETCDKCGTGIKHVFPVTLKDGTVFKYGSECIEKILSGDTSLKALWKKNSKLLTKLKGNLDALSKPNDEIPLGKRAVGDNHGQFIGESEDGKWMTFPHGMLFHPTKFSPDFSNPQNQFVGWTEQGRKYMPMTPENWQKSNQLGIEHGKAHLRKEISRIEIFLAAVVAKGLATKNPD